MNDKVKSVLDGIMKKFTTGDIPKAITYAMFPIPNIPSSHWSFRNKFFMILSGTTDARGFRQWNQVGRTVKRGAKAIYILVPYLMKQVTPDEEEKFYLKGFLAKPVFRVEDTEGEPLDYEKDLPLPDLPLIETAKKWGITVSGAMPFSKAYGVYVPGAQKIILASPEEIVFFHELSHAAYERSVGKLKPGQRWDQEITAELCAQALCLMVGRQPRDNLGNTYRYIDHYAKGAGLSPLTACLQVIDSVEKVLTTILTAEFDESEQQQKLTATG